MSALSDDLERARAALDEACGSLMPLEADLPSDAANDLKTRLERQLDLLREVVSSLQSHIAEGGSERIG
jgi:hypothetical protein